MFEACGRADVVADRVALLDKVAPPATTVRSSAVVEAVEVLDVVEVAVVFWLDCPVLEESLGTGDADMEDICAVVPRAKTAKDARRGIGETIKGEK